MNAPMAWFSSKNKPRLQPGASKATSRMEGLWLKCEGCEEIVYREEVQRNLNVCPLCGYHMAWPIRTRLAHLLDAGTFVESDRDLSPIDPLNFSDSKRYRDRLKSSRRSTQETEGLVAGVGKIEGHPVSVGGFVFEFMGGSMGSVVGEKVTRVFERSLEMSCPAIIFSASGGARMQEGILSLMQMAKTVTTLTQMNRAGLPFLSVLLNPTTGGVAASFGAIGDVIFAEPKALVGFAGPRVIEQTIMQKLPEGFQRGEFLLEHGMIDAIVPRKEMRDRIAQVLRLLAPQTNGAATKH
jgi:acetyl-CoA carboxylase carboxyl transferase subunit beta